jgi:hypothetical protein
MLLLPSSQSGHLGFSFISGGHARYDATVHSGMQAIFGFRAHSIPGLDHSYSFFFSDDGDYARRLILEISI